MAIQAQPESERTRQPAFVPNITTPAKNLVGGEHSLLFCFLQVGKRCRKMRWKTTVGGWGRPGSLTAHNWCGVRHTEIGCQVDIRRNRIAVACYSEFPFHIVYCCQKKRLNIVPSPIHIVYSLQSSTLVQSTMNQQANGKKIWSSFLISDFYYSVVWFRLYVFHQCIDSIFFEKIRPKLYQGWEISSPLC